jgi:ABC-type uncharacterized transport system permease subunit
MEDRLMAIDLIILGSSIVAAATFFLIPTLGELLAERSGVLNLGVEGMIIAAAAGSFVAVHITGNLLFGILAGMLVGGGLALIHAIITITYNRNQVVSGIALTIFGTGFSGFIGYEYVGNPLPQAVLQPLEPITLPGLSSVPVVGPFLSVFFEQDLLVYLSYILVPIFWVIIFKTRPGIMIRTVGENPTAAYSQGVNVALIRYICVIIGGMMCGLGGAYLSLAWLRSWTEGMTSSRGWIVVALTVVGFWHPFGAFVGSYIFGMFDVLQYTFQPFGIPAALLKMLPSMSTILFLVVWGILLTRGKVKRMVGAPSALGTPFQKE